MDVTRAEALLAAVRTVEGNPESGSAWLLDEELHRAWNARLVRFARSAYILGLVVRDVRFDPPVLMLLIKTQRGGDVRYDCRALEEVDPVQAMAVIEEQEGELPPGTRPRERYWLYPPGTEQWIPMRAMLRNLQNRGLITGEFRLRDEA